ncbi:recombinase family protein [Massilia putida]|uniref:recombinase family protein n=1 Tax=Massilia putida TaxID=1141883 RepID=UPI0009532982|nr:recombinase family protein [Massilia putida]
MGQQTFLLQQMLELTDALHRTSAKHAAQKAGYADDPWSDLARQEILRDISERRKAGDSFGCIANALNQRGVRGEHGGRWYGATVRNFILRNDVTTMTQ